MITSIFGFGKRHKRAIQAIIGLILLAVVIFQSSSKELLDNLRNAPLGMIVPWIFIYYFITTLAWGVGLHVLFRRMNRGSFWHLIKASFKLQILSTVVPGRLGDLGLLYFLKEKFTLGQTSAVLVIDKLVTLSVNVVLAIWGIAVLFS